MAAAARVIDQRVMPGGLAVQRTVAVHPALANLFPDGVVRGSSVLCQGAAAASTAFLLTAASSQGDGWVGVAGLPAFGAMACHEMGTVLQRVVVVRTPDPPADDGLWASVLGALVDGFDMVVFGAARHVRPATARRVQARVQTRGGVLVLVGDAGPFSADVRVTTAATWEGLGQGAGHLRQRSVDITVDGRRVPNARHDRLAMPDASGRICSVADVAAVASLTRLRRTG